MLARILTAAVGLLVAAWLIQTAIQLIESVLPQLGILAAVIAVGLIAWRWFRGRKDGW
jgi:hypothetical protein